MYSNKAKRRILSLSILILMLSVLSYGTYAFFVSDDIATNVITTGSIDITLVEQKDDGNGNLVPFENVVGVMPGDVVSKIVSVQNTGGNTAWVRISVNKSLTLENGDDDSMHSHIFTMDFNEADWTYDSGYWYYGKPLEAGECTAPLFTSVTFAGSEMNNDYQNSVAVIEVLAQATQHANNGDSVFEALGWQVMEEY